MKRPTTPADSDRRLRIVSLAPSATSILIALGASRELVGVTKWCADVAPLPRRLRSREAQLGDCWAFDAEQVMALRPTLVIGSVPYRQEAVGRLLVKPVNFLAMNPRTLADVYSDISLLGNLVGRQEAAQTLARQMHRAFQQVALQAGCAQSRPGVYCEAWPRPRISSPPWVAELVELAGGEMVIPPGKRVRDAEVAQARPEVIVLAWAATGKRARVASALKNPAWRATSAVRHHRVYVVRDELLNTPGPPLVEGAWELLRILHPELGRSGKSARRRENQDKAADGS